MALKDLFRRLAFFVVIYTISSSCVEKFYPEIDSGNENLIVDGKITNETGPYEVRLFTTTPLNKRDSFIAEPNATIILHDNKGNSDFFTETSPGIYHNNSSTFLGQVGTSYWIEIETAKGEKYESIPEEMQPGVEIDSVYAEEVEKHGTNKDFARGVEINFDASDKSNKSQYIRWEYHDSWEWHTVGEIPQSEAPHYICYRNSQSTLVHTYDAKFLTEKIIKRLPTTFIPDDEAKFAYEYYINIQLFSINTGAYKFWENIKSIIQSSGTLYDAIPSKLTGNLQSCTEGNRAVLGYFEVSSIRRKGTTFKKNQFDMIFPDTPKECQLIRQFIEKRDINTEKFHIVNMRVDPQSGKTYYNVRYNYCYDCSIKYPVNKPSFWP